MFLLLKNRFTSPNSITALKRLKVGDLRIPNVMANGPTPCIPEPARPSVHSLRVQVLDHGHDDDDEGHGEDLAARADEGGEEHGVAGGPEHVPVDLLPAVLVAQVTVLEQGGAEYNIRNSNALTSSLMGSRVKGPGYKRLIAPK